MTSSSNTNELSKFHINGPSYFIETKTVLEELTLSIYADKDILEIINNKEKFNQLEVGSVH